MPPKKRIVRKRTTKQRGRGAMDDILSSGKIFGITIPELHLRGLSGKYNFAGPFTKLDKRVDANGVPVKGSEPINEIDAIALQHDLDYSRGVKKEDADKKMITSLDKMTPKNWRERVDRFIARSTIRAKQMLGLGRRKALLKKRAKAPVRRQRGGAKMETVIIIKRAPKKRVLVRRQRGGAFSKQDLINRSSPQIELPYRMVTKPMPSYRAYDL